MSNNRPRFTNRGKVSQSPSCGIHSERASWSSASVVSTIYTQSPPPNREEQATQKLPQTQTQSSPKKKWIIGGIICLGSLIALGTIAGPTAFSLLNKSPAQTTTITTAPIVTISTTATTLVSTTTSVPIATTAASLSIGTGTVTVPTTTRTTTSI